jgi:DNA polymerase II small subunit/DNA polymerase delta subunit B
MDKAKEILKSVNRRGLSPKELEQILKCSETSAPKQRHHFDDYFEEKTRIGIFADCHIGAREFDENFFKHMIRKFKEKKVSRIYFVGDLLEGMSGRDGHIYDLAEIGYASQMDKAVRLFKLLPADTYGIDGNHDQWYQRKSDQGVIVGEEMERQVMKYHNLGQDEANVKIRPNITMKLIHPGDGTAYALSYKTQKRIEAFTGGEKPEVLLGGHYHKALYFFYRNIHALESGTICGQTKWMRAKNIAAHKGFWIIDLEMGKGGIGSFSPTFYSGYK